jgi:hypothetical protein
MAEVGKSEKKVRVKKPAQKVVKTSQTTKKVGEQKKRERKPSLKTVVREKIKLPHAKPANKQERAANDEARRQRRVLLLKEKKKAYESHMPKIPVPEQFATYSRAKKSFVSKKIVEKQQNQLEQNLIQYVLSGFNCCDLVVPDIFPSSNLLQIRKHALHNAQKYLREYKKADGELIAKRRVAKQTNTFYVEAEPKVVFVIRIRGM